MRITRSLTTPRRCWRNVQARLRRQHRPGIIGFDFVLSLRRNSSHHESSLLNRPPGSAGRDRDTSRRRCAARRRAPICDKKSNKISLPRKTLIGRLPGVVRDSWDSPAGPVARRPSDGPRILVAEAPRHLRAGQAWLQRQFERTVQPKRT